MDHEMKHTYESYKDSGPVTRLLFSDSMIALEVYHDGTSGKQVTLQAGSMQNILQYLQHEPSTPAELEAAIETIENELMPVISSLPTQRLLVSSDPLIFQIAEHIPGLADKPISREEIESLFNRLADVAYGTPARILSVPENREFAAVLLFLRELMHHANFSTITLLNSIS
jgi:hypothetical protein